MNFCLLRKIQTKPNFVFINSSLMHSTNLIHSQASVLGQTQHTWNCGPITWHILSHDHQALRSLFPAFRQLNATAQGQGNLLLGFALLNIVQSENNIKHSARCNDNLSSSVYVTVLLSNHAVLNRGLNQFSNQDTACSAFQYCNMT